MSGYRASCPIPITPMLQLAEVVDREDDWTGITDAAARRKKQTRLNTRAWRRRKALESKAHHASVSEIGTGTTKTEPEIPCWVEDQQMVSTFPASVVNAFYRIGNALLPYDSTSLPFGRAPVARIIFPLSSDHLITLLQFNVLRGSLINRQLLSGSITAVSSDCSSEALQILPSPSAPKSVPPSLEPTALQRTIPHEDWIDIIPHPTWRDNVILAVGTFDEDDLWSDTIGGLFEGFPHSECEKRGVIAWEPPWDISGWEVSEAFWRKWAWSFKGCWDVLEATNKWRRQRGEEPLVFEL